MSEFFKAAARCDGRVARQAPMYVDETAIMEEQFKHERLVDECIKTKLTLLEANRTLSLDMNADGTPVIARYAPSSRDLVAPPESRRAGTSHLKRRIHDAIFERSREMESTHQRLREIEARERADYARRVKQSNDEDRMQSAGAAKAVQDAPRTLSPPRTALEVAATENGLNDVNTKARRRHPIDVVQALVQQSILAEVAEYDHAQRTAVVLRQESVEDTVDRKVAEEEDIVRRRQARHYLMENANDPAIRDFLRAETLLNDYHTRLSQQTAIVQARMDDAEREVLSLATGKWIHQRGSIDDRLVEEMVRVGPQLETVVGETRVQECMRVLLGHSPEFVDDVAVIDQVLSFAHPVESIHAMCALMARLITEAYATSVEFANCVAPQHVAKLSNMARSLRKVLASEFLMVNRTHSSTSQLQREIEQLQGTVERLAQQFNRASHYGKELLKENETLRAKYFSSTTTGAENAAESIAAVFDTSPDASASAARSLQRGVVLLQVEGLAEVRKKKPHVIADSLQLVRSTLLALASQFGGVRTNFNAAAETDLPFDARTNPSFPPQSYVFSFPTAVKAIMFAVEVQSTLTDRTQWGDALLALPAFAAITRSIDRGAAPVAVWKGLRLRAVVHFGTPIVTHPLKDMAAAGQGRPALAADSPGGSPRSDGSGGSPRGAGRVLDIPYLAGMMMDAGAMVLQETRGGETMVTAAAYKQFEKAHFDDHSIGQGIIMEQRVASGFRSGVDENGAMYLALAVSHRQRLSPVAELRFRELFETTFAPVGFWRQLEAAGLDSLQPGDFDDDSENAGQGGTRLLPHQYEEKIKTLTSELTAARETLATQRAFIERLTSEGTTRADDVATLQSQTTFIQKQVKQLTSRWQAAKRRCERIELNAMIQADHLAAQRSRRKTANVACMTQDDSLTKSNEVRAGRTGLENSIRRNKCMSCDERQEWMTDAVVWSRRLVETLRATSSPSHATTAAAVEVSLLQAFNSTTGVNAPSLDEATVLGGSSSTAPHPVIVAATAVSIAREFLQILRSRESLESGLKSELEKQSSITHRDEGDETATSGDVHSPKASERMRDLAQELAATRSNMTDQTSRFAEIRTSLETRLNATNAKLQQSALNSINFIGELRTLLQDAVLPSSSGEGLWSKAKTRSQVEGLVGRYPFQNDLDEASLALHRRNDELASALEASRAELRSKEEALAIAKEDRSTLNSSTTSESQLSKSRTVKRQSISTPMKISVAVGRTPESTPRGTDELVDAQVREIRAAMEAERAAWLGQKAIEYEQRIESVKADAEERARGQMMEWDIRRNQEHERLLQSIADRRKVELEEQLAAIEHGVAQRVMKSPINVPRRDSSTQTIPVDAPSKAGGSSRVGSASSVQPKPSFSAASGLPPTPSVANRKLGIRGADDPSTGSQANSVQHSLDSSLSADDGSSQLGVPLTRMPDAPAVAPRGALTCPNCSAALHVDVDSPMGSVASSNAPQEAAATANAASQAHATERGRPRRSRSVGTLADPCTVHDATSQTSPSVTSDSACQTGLLSTALRPSAATQTTLWLQSRAAQTEQWFPPTALGSSRSFGVQCSLGAIAPVPVSAVEAAAPSTSAPQPLQPASHDAVAASPLAGGGRSAVRSLREESNRTEQPLRGSRPSSTGAAAVPTDAMKTKVTPPLLVSSSDDEPLGPFSSSTPKAEHVAVGARRVATPLETRRSTSIAGRGAPETPPGRALSGLIGRERLPASAVAAPQLSATPNKGTAPTGEPEGSAAVPPESATSPPGGPAKAARPVVGLASASTFAASTPSSHYPPADGTASPSLAAQLMMHTMAREHVASTDYFPPSPKSEGDTRRLQHSAARRVPSLLEDSDGDSPLSAPLPPVQAPERLATPRVLTAAGRRGGWGAGITAEAARNVAATGHPMLTRPREASVRALANVKEVHAKYVVIRRDPEPMVLEGAARRR